MKISDMRDRITFLKEKEQIGAVKDYSNDAYEDYITVWSKVEYFSSKEIYSAKAVNILDSVKFIIRFRKDIKHDMRIRLGKDDIYEIKGIRPLDQKKMYMLIVGEMINHE